MFWLGINWNNQYAIGSIYQYRIDLSSIPKLTHILHLLFTDNKFVHADRHWRFFLPHVQSSRSVPLSFFNVIKLYSIQRHSSIKRRIYSSCMFCLYFSQPKRYSLRSVLRRISYSQSPVQLQRRRSQEFLPELLLFSRSKPRRDVPEPFIHVKSGVPPVTRSRIGASCQRRGGWSSSVHRRARVYVCTHVRSRARRVVSIPTVTRVFYRECPLIHRVHAFQCPGIVSDGCDGWGGGEGGGEGRHTRRVWRASQEEEEAEVMMVVVAMISPLLSTTEYAVDRPSCQ